MNERTRLPGRWYSIDISCPLSREDDVLGLIYDDGYLGSQTTPAGPSAVRVNAWYETEAQAVHVSRSVRAFANAEGEDAIRLSEPEPRVDEGWLEKSLIPRGVLDVGRFAVLDAESWDGSQLEGERVGILIPLGRAFGTGEHETTRMCLELFDAVGAASAEQRVLDLGTGSGILAIAAAKLGAQVVAIDNDAAVEDVLRENLELNAVSESVEFRLGTASAIDHDDAFDVALINIHKSGVIASVARVAQVLDEKTGRCIVSGFHVGDVTEVSDAWIRRGMKVLRIAEDGEWAAVAFGRE